MQTNVSGLLRNFADVRRAALAGETVVITTREGNLLLMAERRGNDFLYGSLKDVILKSDDVSAADFGQLIEFTGFRGLLAWF